MLSNFLPMSIFIDNIKTVLVDKDLIKIINLGSKSLTLYDLALKIQSRLKIKKNIKKILKFLQKKKLKN